jgi:hypothetical protein
MHRVVELLFAPDDNGRGYQIGDGWVCEPAWSVAVLIEGAVLSDEGVAGGRVLRRFGFHWQETT